MSSKKQKRKVPASAAAVASASAQEEDTKTPPKLYVVVLTKDGEDVITYMFYSSDCYDPSDTNDERRKAMGLILINGDIIAILDAMSDKTKPIHHDGEVIRMAFRLLFGGLDEFWDQDGSDCDENGDAKSGPDQFKVVTRHPSEPEKAYAAAVRIFEQRHKYNNWFHEMELQWDADSRIDIHPCSGGVYYRISD